MILTEDVINRAKQIIKEREETNEIFGFGGLPSYEKVEKAVPGLNKKMTFGGDALARMSIFGDKNDIKTSPALKALDDASGARLKAMQSRKEMLDATMNQFEGEMSKLGDEEREFIRSNKKAIAKRVKMMSDLYAVAIKKQAKLTPKSKGGEGPEARKASPKSDEGPSALEREAQALVDRGIARNIDGAIKIIKSRMSPEEEKAAEADYERRQAIKKRTFSLGRRRIGGSGRV